jgi:hypothetical protein
LLRFRDEDRIQILDNLDRDVKVLQSHNIMDYSLLFAIEKNPDFDRFSHGKTKSSQSDDD